MSDPRRPRFASRRPTVAGGALALLLPSIVAGALWFWLQGPSTRTTPAGAEVGRLPRRVEPSDLNLLLITLDTTRADRIGAYGWTPSATPNLDRIGGEGVVFEHAAAQFRSLEVRHALARGSRKAWQRGVVQETD